MKRHCFDKMISAAGAGALVLVLGTVGLLYAGQDQHDQDVNHQKQDKQAVQPRPNQDQQDNRHQQQQVQGRQHQERQAEDQRNQQHQEHQTEVQQNQQRQDKRIEEQQAQQKVLQQTVWQNHRAHNWKAEHRTWQKRGGYKGYRIPKNSFHASFGRNHAFGIHRLSYKIYGGYPSFEFNGFWFSVVDPWPEYWSNNWYHNDDVYIDYYGGGYYLYNRRHPRDRIAVTFYSN